MKRLKLIWWIDDMRNPSYETWIRQYSLEHSDVVWLKSYDEMCERLKYEWPDMIYFDHDLGSSKSGYDCARKIIEFHMEHPQLIFPGCNSQSSNPVGKQNILSLFRSYLKSSML